MFANINRHAILDEFKALLSKYVDHSQQIREERKVWYYGQVGLCTMVNSQEYINEDLLNGWLRTIEKNQQFWLDKQEELYKLTKKVREIGLSEVIPII